MSITTTTVLFTTAEDPEDPEVREAVVPDGEFYVDWIAEREGLDPDQVNLIGRAEWATSTEHNDGWVCPCGNDESTGGFCFVTADRVEVDPTEAAWPKPLYGCNECGRVIDQDSLRPNPRPTDSYDTHRVAVVSGPGTITYKD